MNRKSKWLGALGLSLVAACLLTCAGIGAVVRFAPDIYQLSLKQTSLKVGAFAPDFELASLDGGKVRLSQFEGSPVLLTFGATWCPDCRHEAPLVQDLHIHHPELVVLLVDSRESPAIVRDYVEEFDITHPVLLDANGAVQELYQVFAIPTALFIDADGVIQAKLIESVTPELLAEKLPLIGVQP